MTWEHGIEPSEFTIEIARAMRPLILRGHEIEWRTGGFGQWWGHVIRHEAGWPYPGVYGWKEAIDRVWVSYVG